MDHGASASPERGAGPERLAARRSAAPPAEIPAGWSEHDVVAKTKVDRFLAAEYDELPAPNALLEPTLDGDVKVFELTIDEIEHRIDGESEPLAALGFNGVWTGPQIRVVEGDRVRAVFTNNLKETTGIHFHGQDLPNAVDGVPMITQEPIVPGATYAYEFVAGPSGSHMYHSHHNATDQVGRGLLGAFIVEPQDPADRPANLYGTTPGHRLDQQRHAGRLHDQRPRVPGDLPDRRPERRQDPDPLHERGRDDASVASPRPADASRGA